MQENHWIALRLQQEADYRCRLEFADAVPPLIADEPPPLGQSAGPSPVQLLLGAVANCLTDSLLFALRKFRLHAEPLRCEARAEVGRNSEQRQRVLAIEVELHLGQMPADSTHLQRVLEQFEGFCTVSQSVAAGIPIRLQVFAADGQLLRQS